MIIGITGSFGAGKGEVVEYLKKAHDFSHYSASGFITEEILRRSLPVDRDNMTAVANDLRLKHGPSYVVDSLYARAQAAGGNVVIESLRAPAEVARIRELGGFVIGVDAPAQLRYDRAVKRGSEKDAVTFDYFLAQEKREQNPDDPTKQNIFEALKLSDVVIQNDDTLEVLAQRIEKILPS
ncbi:hypothetical protein A3C87_01370 [Candidatus Kaiserbacteria bacterium RIFCSPHIGHO2_02_FULL_49_34]|uniref:Dephospho-CoA kinase n=1 Tax=Candidatus Kaiserbacteria bacterium RIFCSPHIGHO2_02_FULL_49_34 TaxID=1798491 RepID=A0A1F6DMW3_9BACT|nr:MAG: hypothetical protein A3C87_01370 [Candidatus Kaiserbacteria bacterium RIFCSPHIGHO2_02_FULL_49_34]